eukprot:865058-Pelagomonas_calceolata.AAC.6
MFSYLHDGHHQKGSWAWEGQIKTFALAHACSPPWHMQKLCKESLAVTLSKSSRSLHVRMESLPSCAHAETQQTKPGCHPAQAGRPLFAACMHSTEIMSLQQETQKKKPGCRPA